MRYRLSAWLASPDAAPGVVTGQAPHQTGPLVFVFTGQGSQWWAMGQQLLEREPIVRETIERID
jgi:acyl transferase domain-containing protein